MQKLRKGLLPQESADLSASPIQAEELAPLDLEQEFVNHLSISQDLIYVIREGVSSELLNRPNNRAVLGFATHYHGVNGIAPPREVLLTEFESLDFDDPVASVEWIVSKLRERYQRNKVQQLILSAGKLTATPSEALAVLREGTSEIENSSISTQYVWGPGDHDYFIQRMQDKIIAGQYRGMSTGFKDIDDFTGGLKPGYLAGISARPKRQKTFFALQSFIAQAYQGNTPIFFTLENTEEEIWYRLACMVSGFPWDKMQRGEVMPGDWKMIVARMDEFDAVTKYYIARPPVGERKVSSLLLQADKVDANSIIVSQFKYIEPSKDYYKAENEKWASVVLDLKLAATKSGSERPIYIETQLNREAQSMTEMQDADLAQLGLTDMWGQACDIMFCIFQNRDLRASGVSEFGIIEARNSDKHSWLIQSEFKETTELKIV